MLILSHHPQVISITKSSITSVVGLVSAEMAVAESDLGAHYPTDVLKIPGGWHHYIKFTYDPPSLILRVADASGVQVRNLCLDRLTDLIPDLSPRRSGDKKSQVARKVVPDPKPKSGRVKFIELLQPMTFYYEQIRYKHVVWMVSSIVVSRWYEMAISSGR